MKKINFYGFKGLTMINGWLTPIKVDEVIMREDCSVLYTTEDGTLINPVLYESKEDFEKGKPCELKEIILSTNISYKEESNLIYTKTWKMQDGEPKEIYLPLKFKVNWHTRSTFLAKPIIPEEDGYYAYREDCIRYGKYILKEEDGTIHEEIGIGLKLQLSDAQKEFIQKDFIPILEKAKEMGIQLIHNNCYDKLYAVNVNNLNGELQSEYDEIGPQYVSSDRFFEVSKQIWSDNDLTVWYDFWK